MSWTSTRAVSMIVGALVVLTAVVVAMRAGMGIVGGQVSYEDQKREIEDLATELRSICDQARFESSGSSLEKSSVFNIGEVKAIYTERAGPRRGYERLVATLDNGDEERIEIGACNFQMTQNPGGSDTALWEFEMSVLDNPPDAPPIIKIEPQPE